MKMLFIVPYTPNLIRVRPYQLIRALARRGHRLSLVTVWTSDAERSALEQLAADGVRVVADRLTIRRSLWNCLCALPGRTPLQAAFCWNPAVARRLESALRDPDLEVVHVEHLRGAHYGLRAIQVLGANDRGDRPIGSPRPVVVWDSVDCISHLFAQAARESRSLTWRLMAGLELERTRRYEAWLLNQFDRTLVTSEVDRQALLSLSRHARPITVLPNGVDLDYFVPAPGPREPATLVITGKMSYHANVTAVLHLVRDIMPHIWARRPEVRLWVVGKDPAREIRALDRRTHEELVVDGSSAFESVRPSHRGGHVSVIGSVSDIRPYLRRATLAVAPLLYGAGIQNKVLEAMACGIPVVASPQATSALAVRPGYELTVARSPEEFAWTVLSLLDAPDRRMQLAQAGRAYAEAHHGWEVIAAQLEETYRDTVDLASNEGMVTA